MDEFKRIKLVVAYDGTGYNGWQMQPGKTTVQATIESAFAVIYRESIRIVGAGRTDTGVHARAMVAHCDLSKSHDIEQIQYRLNSLLPSDIRILHASEVSSDFHARFSALSRRYTYTIITQPDPFLERFAWEVHWVLDLDKLTEASTLIIGERDFVTCQNHSGSDSTICTVTEFQWSREGYIYKYTISANRFVHGMVRFLVGMQVAYARNALTLQEYTNAFKIENNRARAFKAPARGLCLTEVKY